MGVAVILHLFPADLVLQYPDINTPASKAHIKIKALSYYYESCFLVPDEKTLEADFTMMKSVGAEYVVLYTPLENANLIAKEAKFARKAGLRVWFRPRWTLLQSQNRISEAILKQCLTKFKNWIEYNKKRVFLPSDILTPYPTIGAGEASRFNSIEKYNNFLREVMNITRNLVGNDLLIVPVLDAETAMQVLDDETSNTFGKTIGVSFISTTGSLEERLEIFHKRWNESEIIGEVGSLSLLFPEVIKDISDFFSNNLGKVVGQTVLTIVWNLQPYSEIIQATSINRALEILYSKPYVGGISIFTWGQGDKRGYRLVKENYFPKLALGVVKAYFEINSSYSLSSHTVKIMSRLSSYRCMHSKMGE